MVEGADPRDEQALMAELRAEDGASTVQLGGSSSEGDDDRGSRQTARQVASLVQALQNTVAAQAETILRLKASAQQQGAEARVAAARAEERQVTANFGRTRPFHKALCGTQLSAFEAALRICAAAVPSVGRVGGMERRTRRWNDARGAGLNARRSVCCA